MRLTTGEARRVRQSRQSPSTGPLAASVALGVGLLSVFLVDQATGSAPVQPLHCAAIRAPSEAKALDRNNVCVA